MSEDEAGRLEEALADTWEVRSGRVRVDRLLSALLPVVDDLIERAARERAAEELEAAAEGVGGIQATGRPYDMAEHLRRQFAVRAAALRGGDGR